MKPTTVEKNGKTVLENYHATPQRLQMILECDYILIEQEEEGRRRSDETTRSEAECVCIFFTVEINKENHAVICKLLAQYCRLVGM